MIQVWLFGDAAELLEDGFAAGVTSESVRNKAKLRHTPDKIRLTALHDAVKKAADDSVLDIAHRKYTSAHVLVFTDGCNNVRPMSYLLCSLCCNCSHARHVPALLCKMIMNSRQLQFLICMCIHLIQLPQKPRLKMIMDTDC